MDTALKQRLTGAAVLVLLAVVFLPMIVTGPAPDGSKDMEGVPTTVPAAPGATVELQGPTIDFNAPVTGTDSAATVPTVAEDAPSQATGPTYVVDFAAYGTAADAQTVIAALNEAGITSTRSSAVNKAGREVHQVTIGPFGSMAEAEQARMRSVKVSDVPARIRTIAGSGEVATTAPATASAPVKAVPSEPTTTKTVAKAPVKEAPKPAASAANETFALQLGAFEYPGQAEELHRKAAAAGFRTILVKGKDKQGRPITRVRTSAVKSRTEAESLKAEIAVKLNRSAQIQTL